MKKLLLSLILVNLLAACASDKPKEAVVEPQAAAANDAAARAKAEAEAAERAKVEAEAAAKAEADAAARAKAEAEAAAKSALDKRSVYFPFDVDAIQAADKDTIVAHGKNLEQNPQLKVRVEGNCDERGSSEYNLALGQRRAKNTKKALVLAGAKAAQIQTISYGESKPVAPGHDEASWAQNRRADINYNAGK